MNVREAPEEMLRAELDYRRGRINTWTVDGDRWISRRNMIVRLDVVREGIVPEPWRSELFEDVAPSDVVARASRFLRGDVFVGVGNGKLPGAFRPLVESCDRCESVGGVVRLFRGDVLIGIVTEVREDGDADGQFVAAEVIRAR